MNSCIPAYNVYLLKLTLNFDLMQKLWQIPLHCASSTWLTNILSMALLSGVLGILALLQLGAQASDWRVAARIAIIDTITGYIVASLYWQLTGWSRIAVIYDRSRSPLEYCIQSYTLKRQSWVVRHCMVWIDINACAMTSRVCTYTTYCRHVRILVALLLHHALIDWCIYAVQESTITCNDPNCTIPDMHI